MFLMCWAVKPEGRCARLGAAVWWIVTDLTHEGGFLPERYSANVTGDHTIPTFEKLIPLIFIQSLYSRLFLYP